MKTGFQETTFTRRFDTAVWKKILGMMRSYRGRMALLTAVMIAVGVIDTVFPALNGYAIDRFIVPGRKDGLVGFAAVYAVLVLVQTLNVWLVITLAGGVEVGIAYDLRARGFRRLQELSFSYFDRTPLGWIMARMTSDATRLGEVVSWALVDIVWGAMVMAATAVAMFILNWRLALLVLSVVPVLAVVSNYFQKRILAGHRQVRKTNSKISGAYNEGIMGARTTKTLVREAENLREFAELTTNMRRYSVQTAVLSSLYLPVVLALGTVGTAAAFWAGGRGIIAGTITYGTVATFVGYTVLYFEPVRELARVFAELQAAQASAERIIAMIETEPEIQDTPEVIARYGDSFLPNYENWERPVGQVEFRNVGFTYPDGERVLENFNLTVGQGETVALVGETGSGKSTIVNLLCRFYEPTEGQILIDDTDYRERSQLWLHRHLGYVLQTPQLFSGTVRENIRYGRLDATDDEIEEAARIVNAGAFIGRLENGFDTDVGEGGSLLSVGEKQLISFARAILADPVFFILDEATSSVDTETEQLIQDAIRTLLHDRTSFVIAHRLSTIRDADRIVVIHEGRIVEDGTHDSLMSAKGRYHRLYTNQFVEDRSRATLS